MPDSPRIIRQPVRRPTISVNSKPIQLPPGPLRSSTLHAAGLPKLYDPGYATTAAYTSAITFINGQAGILRHRGYAISDLCRSTTFDEVAHLLIYGNLPTLRQLDVFRAAIVSQTVPCFIENVISAFSPSAHPMSMLIACLSALGAAFPGLNPAIAGADVYKNNLARDRAVVIVLGCMPRIAACILRHMRCETAIMRREVAVKGSYGKRFLWLTKNDGDVINEKLAQALDMLFILHADHEQNCSTATVRQLSSSGVDVFSSLCGGVAALYGGLHGGACEGVLKMLVRIGSVHGVKAFLEGVKRQEERLIGFGHRIYRNYDPRAVMIRDVAYEVFEIVGRVDPLIEVARAVEEAALKDDYFVSRKLYPNVDFYSGVIYKAMGFETEFFPVLFALGRCAGWVAHWKEFLDDEDRRIARPHQRFVGLVGPRDVPHIAQRREGQSLTHQVAKEVVAGSKL